jgi:DNA-binding MarR family transcriptional regulator
MSIMSTLQSVSTDNPQSVEQNTTPVVTSESLRLENLLGYALRRAQWDVSQHLRHQLNTFDLRPAQFSALLLIEQNPGLMQSDLAGLLTIEPPQMVIMLNKLEKLGVAVRVRCKPDKRSYGIFLSKAGEGLLKQLKQIVLQSDLQATAALTAEERVTLHTLLQKLYKRSDANS